MSQKLPFTMLGTACLAAVALCSVRHPHGQAASAADTRKEVRFVQAFGSHGLAYKMDEPFSSPDARWAVIVISDPPSRNLIIVPKGLRRPAAVAVSLEGFMWLPDRPHSLVVATDSIYGRANLLLWTGGSTWRHLARPERSFEDIFGIVGYDVGKRELHYAYERRLKLRLPFRR